MSGHCPAINFYVAVTMPIDAASQLPRLNISPVTKTPPDFASLWEVVQCFAYSILS
jgi:hypothetical protein